ncbi:MAG: glycosyltransferase family 4 protein [Acidimicrobiales bacterium]|jgi:colanic acid biosynthesis glycosyl transferase WcaI|nr:glycosyltransferase family 4 protein [Acidimicrobiales bacterium]
MKITIICPHFAPDTAPTGEVMTQIVNELQHLGHRIHVVTSLPWYRDHSVEPGWTGRLISREKTSWGKITRIHPFASKNRTNILARAIAFGAFSCAAALVATLTRRTEIILAMSPPLTLGLAGWVAAKRHKAPLILNIQDIHPDAAIATGTLTDTRVIQLLRRIELTSYAKADAVTVLSDDLRKKLISRIDEESKLRVIPNFVDTEQIYPGDRNNSYRHELGVTDETIVMYAGNVGFSQPLELVLEAARYLADRDDIIFVINGNGSRRAYFEKEAEELPNVTFMDYQPRQRLNEVLAAGDIHIIPLQKGLSSISVPSKFYSILAAGRPVLASVDPGTEIDLVVTRSGAGRSTPAGDTQEFIAALTALIDDPHGRVAAGLEARRFAEEWLSAKAVAESYNELFPELRQ